jgi:hypothetical protein
MRTAPISRKITTAKWIGGVAQAAERLKQTRSAEFKPQNHQKSKKKEKRKVKC